MELPPVQYVTTSDGFNIAYAAVGTGRPFVFAPLPFSDLGYYAKAPADEFPMLEGLATRFRLVLFDGRGQGMSTRGLPDGLLRGPRDPELGPLSAEQGARPLSAQQGAARTLPRRGGPVR